jgi:hypothetical protein
MFEGCFSIRVRHIPTQNHHAWVTMKWLTAVDALEIDASPAVFNRPSAALLAGEKKLVSLLP